MDVHYPVEQPHRSSESTHRIVFFLLLLLLLLISFFIRQVAPHSVPLTMDSLDTLTEARAMTRGEFIPLENEGSFAGMATAPMAEWLFALPLFVSDSLNSAILFTIFGNLLAAALLTFCCTPLIGRCGGLVAVSLLLFNLHHAAWFSRQPINSNLAAPFAILFLFLLLRLRNSPARIQIFSVTLTLGILLQLHPASWSLLLLYPLQRYLTGSVRSRREIVPALCGLLLPLIPLLIAELIQGFPTLLAFGNHLLHPPPGGDAVARPPWVILEELLAIFSGDRLEVYALFFVGAGLLFSDLRKPELWQPALLLLSGLFLPLLYLAGVSTWLGGRFFPHYLTTILPFAALICGRGFLGVWQLPSRIQRPGLRPLSNGLAGMILLILLQGIYMQSLTIPQFLRNIPLSLMNRGGLEQLTKSLDQKLLPSIDPQPLRLQFLSNQKAFLSPNGMSYLLRGQSLGHSNAGIPLHFISDFDQSQSAQTLITIGIIPQQESSRLDALPGVEILDDCPDPDFLIFYAATALPVGFLQPGEVLTGPVPYQP